MSIMKDKILNLLENSYFPIGSKTIEEILECEKSAIELALTELLEERKIDKTGNGQNTKYGLKDRFSEEIPYVGNFADIKNADGLIPYLSHVTGRIDNKDVLCHYTNLDAAISIINNKCWYLNSPKKMNDGIELSQMENGNTDIFFSSFMIEKRESIAMWSMYAQPWKDGVIISIPANKFKEWVKTVHSVYPANSDTKQPDDNMDPLHLNNAQISITRVAYYKQNENGRVTEISCGKAKNTHIKSIDLPQLAGYVKSDAWSYEKEVRLRVDMEKGHGYDGVCIKIPEDVIDSITITKGPCFEGNLEERLKAKIKKKITQSTSLFYNELKQIPCHKCKEAKGGKQ